MIFGVSVSMKNHFHAQYVIVILQMLNFDLRDSEFGFIVLDFTKLVL